MLSDSSPPSLPVIAGAKQPFGVATSHDARDPQCRRYPRQHGNAFLRLPDPVASRNHRPLPRGPRDILLGVPTAYRNASGELAGFLSYGHAYGLLQYDFVRDYLLELYSLSAHQYTRGTWTAPETRRIDPTLTAAPYCVPAQLSVPLLVRWMLAFEDPNSHTLWFCKATPREWLRDGSGLAASAIPTRWARLASKFARIWPTAASRSRSSCPAPPRRAKQSSGCACPGSERSRPSRSAGNRGRISIQKPKPSRCPLPPAATSS